MKNILAENLGLLNRMYEGLIVLKKENKMPAFASKPAVKILRSESGTKRKEPKGSNETKNKSEVGKLESTHFDE